MDLTKQHFGTAMKDLDKIEKKIVKAKEEDRSTLTLELKKDRIVADMSSTFESLYDSDFELSGSDVAGILDVSEYYLFLKLKDKLDFIKPPREAFAWINRDLELIRQDLVDFYVTMSNHNKLEDEDQKIYDFLKRKKAELKALKRKKVFVSKSSLVRFLGENVEVEVQNEQVVISKNELNSELSNKAIAKLIEEFKSEFLGLDKGEKIVSYTKLSSEFINQILTNDLQILSGNSIKDRFVIVKSTTVHNTQLYRFLEQKAKHSKLIIKSTVAGLKKESKQQSLVRYVLDVESQSQIFDNDELIVFSVPGGVYYDEIEEDFLDFANGPVEDEENGEEN